MATNKPRIILEQYATRLNDLEHKGVQDAVKWLAENNYPVNPKSKYDIARYALINLTAFVKFKKVKNNSVPVVKKQEAAETEYTQVAQKATEKVTENAP